MWYWLKTSEHQVCDEVLSEDSQGKQLQEKETSSTQNIKIHSKCLICLIISNRASGTSSHLINFSKWKK